MFKLIFCKFDTRYQKKEVINYIGTWINKNDTITLTAFTPDYTCYFKNARYVRVKGVLTLVSERNDCLPGTFEYLGD
jgi:hypothetical protein